MDAPELNKGKTPAVLEQEFKQTHSGHKSIVYCDPDSEPVVLTENRK